jgi:hypothetical protein
MGRKQREKKLRQQEATAVKTNPPKPNARWAWGWLLGIIVLLLGALVGIFIYVQAHQVQFFRVGVLYTTQKVEQELNRYQGRFLQEEAAQLREILNVIENLAADKNLDAPSSGQLNFILRVVEEIILQGQLQSEEMAKMQSLLQTVRNYLDRRQTGQPAAAKP